MLFCLVNRRNKKLLDREIERGFGKGLDPLKMADELFQRAESRKVGTSHRLPSFAYVCVFGRLRVPCERGGIRKSHLFR